MTWGFEISLVDVKWSHCRYHYLVVPLHPYCQSRLSQLRFVASTGISGKHTPWQQSFWVCNFRVDEGSRYIVPRVWLCLFQNVFQWLYSVFFLPPDTNGICGWENFNIRSDFLEDVGGWKLTESDDGGWLFYCGFEGRWIQLSRRLHYLGSTF